MLNRYLSQEKPFYPLTPMITVERSVLVGHSAVRMRTLVEDIESYPLFLPWCGGAHVQSRDEQSTIASLVIDWHGIRQGFTTDNSREGEQAIRIKLVSGPFRSLSGIWQFKPLEANASKVSLQISYEFSNRLLAAAIGPVFKQLASSLVDAFVHRADALHGH